MKYPHQTEASSVGGRVRWCLQFGGKTRPLVQQALRHLDALSEVTVCMADHSFSEEAKMN